MNVHGGVMLSNAYGGFYSTTTYAVPAGKKILTATVDAPRTREYNSTIGVRIRF